MTPPPSSPLVTPKPNHISPGFTIQPSNDANTSRLSLKSVLTESSLATPASSHPMPIPTIQQPLNLSGIYSHVRSWVIPSPSLVPKRAMSPAKVKPLKLMVSARNTRTYAIKVVSPPESPHSFPDESAVQWKASTILLEQPHVKRAPEHQQLRGCRLLHEFPLQTDEDPSLRARGRKTSRAVA